ncbi:hypothetical protein DDB_G0268308 [Dictyostelium discoideum AX4]|uniref:hypothetical protein n=1 Tax=Dictyostelium discoideum AX4 TaxID=352472 RepID=UPI00004E4066|nr:hypothetical protein DDB_G0268308 [Dictyostelium discoideum AX4]EAL73607.1 hypothetical protein DDB_G0268308 [Dictyostelium discoideum AX4]|eukprot:XP_647217.1 hypothetical protein DDB_G0268308 [Dictyostelium discoideum AX4]
MLKVMFYWLYLLLDITYYCCVYVNTFTGIGFALFLFYDVYRVLFISLLVVCCICMFVFVFVFVFVFMMWCGFYIQVWLLLFRLI